MAFETTLDLRYLDGRDWMLLQPLRWRSPAGGVIEVPKGFVTDFASVPRLFWRLVPPHGDGRKGTYGPAAVIHDFIYEAGALEGRRISRWYADAVFYDIMLGAGVAKWRCVVMWMAVRAFGWWARRQHRKRWTGRGHFPPAPHRPPPPPENRTHDNGNG